LRGNSPILARSNVAADRVSSRSFTDAFVVPREQVFFAEALRARVASSRRALREQPKDPR